MRVACYVRVSTENQLENYSIDEQTERLKAYCKAKDYDLYNIYVDGGYSGGSLTRPALIRMLADIKARLFDTIIVYKLDRLSRSQKDTLTLIEDSFLANNIDFISVSENFDTSTPFGRAMIGILSVFAQLEKDQITERFTMGRIGRSKAGYYHGGSTPPTGYDYVDGLLIPNQYTAMQVKEVYDKFLKGYSINSIQKLMNSKYGGWSSSTLVLNILKNTVYIGNVKFKGAEYIGLHEPIIDISSFNSVQELLKSATREESKTSAQKTPFKASNLLTSLIYCEHCGARYSGNHGYYKCYSRAKSSKRFIKDSSCKNDNWEIHKLDELILSEVLKLRYNHDKIDSLLEDSINSNTVDTTAIKNRIIEIDNQMNKMLDLYQISKLPFEKVSERIKKLQNEKYIIQGQLMTCTHNDYQTQQTKGLPIYIKALFDSNSIEEKRLYINKLIEAIYVDNKKIRIKWRI